MKSLINFFSTLAGAENIRNIKADAVDGTSKSVQPGTFSKTGCLHKNTKPE